MKSAAPYLIVFALGAAAGAVVYGLLMPGRPPSGTESVGSPEPLYWVAPMDPNYRRDGPGKSPMGMDLVPVYAEDPAAASRDEGVVRISSAVENNLGVRVEQVQRRRLATDISTVGYVQYDEDRLIHIHSRVSGWIEKLHVKAEGDPVARDQPLYDLYSPVLVNAQEEFLLALNRGDEELQRAARDRLLALQLSPAFIDQLKREGQVRQTVTFRAPQHGVVDNLNVREGFFVGPERTLMAIGALDDVWVQVEVFERQAARVRVGQPVTMTLAYLPGQAWQGKVDYVYPSLDAQMRTLRVRLRFDNEQGQLRPNMFAQVTIRSDDREEVLAVPREALIRTGRQERVVLALGEGRYRSVPVRTGRQDAEFVEIVAGLQAGDQVVISAQFLLDSESSRRADLRRLESPEDPHAHHHPMGY